MLLARSCVQKRDHTEPVTLKAHDNEHLGTLWAINHSLIFKNLKITSFFKVCLSSTHFYFWSLTIFGYLTQKMSIKKKKYFIHSSILFPLIPLWLEITWTQPTPMTSISLVTLKTLAIVSFLLFCLSLLPLSFFHLKMESELSFSASGKWPERV